MSERLLVRLHPDGRLSWLVTGPGRQPLSASQAGPPPPATIARAREVVVLVPGERVLVLEADAVSANRAQLAKAIPFALEDQLVGAVEDLHFALPAHIEGRRIVVAAVAASTLREWLAALAAHGVRPDVLLPETLALPDAGATLTIEPERALLRVGTARALAFDTAQAAQWIAAIAPPALDVRDFRAAPRLELPAAVAAYRERQTDALAFLAGQLGAAAPLNLLQGDFAPRHRHLPARQLWRRAALLAAAAAVLALAFALGDFLRLRGEAARLESAERALLRTSLPDLGDVGGDPRQLMQSTLARLRGDATGSGLLPLLGRIGPILSGTTRVQLRGLEYRNAVLELGLRAPDVPALDLVREQIANLGLRVEVTSAASGEKGVDGRLRISGAGS